MPDPSPVTPALVAPPLHFAETFAGYAIVNKAGIPPELIFIDIGINPATGKKSLCVIVRAFVGDAKAVFATDDLPPYSIVQVQAELNEDTTRWNALPHEAREAHMRASRMFEHSGEIVLLLATKGLFPRQQTPDVKA